MEGRHVGAIPRRKEAEAEAKASRRLEELRDGKLHGKLFTRTLYDALFSSSSMLKEWIVRKWRHFPVLFMERTLSPRWNKHRNALHDTLARFRSTVTAHLQSSGTLLDILCSLSPGRSHTFIAFSGLVHARYGNVKLTRSTKKYLQHHNTEVEEEAVFDISFICLC
jgi:hypothetical protein